MGRARRGYLTRMAIFGLAIAVFASLGLTRLAEAARPTTWIILDTDGNILEQHDPDALNYPASLTKMMTLFLTFDALEHHRISLDTQFTVSRHAATQKPSKLNLVPGQTVRVQDLILAIVTHSANDAAVTLAEGLGGDEASFAERMNQEARVLGMKRTNFRNASGLPDRFQYTTARDLSKLALALNRTFPREYHYFATESFTYDGITYGTHNHLMAAFQGMDGIKTGFINASGFNLAASAVRDHRRLVGVIMGGRTAHSRDMEMAALLDNAFARDSDGKAATMAVASNAPAQAEEPAQLRRDDGLSRLADAVSQSDDAASAESEPTTAIVHTAAVSHRRHHHQRRIVFRHHLRHGMVLASAEESWGRTSRRHHHTRHVARVSRHHVGHRYSAHHRFREAAAGHHNGRHIAFRHTHRRVAAVSARQVRTHGFACGGWNGSSRPCPRGLRGPGHRETLRSA
jgi:D-alanyl-D-alanine carboxypeptidase